MKALEGLLTRLQPLLAAALVILAGCADDPPEPQAPPAERIIISGASGQLGGQVVAELLARGIPPRELILVSRTPEELAHYADLGAITRFGDFTQPESLATAYEGGTRILIVSLNTNGNPNPRVARERQELQRTAINAAVEAGVQHIVYTSFVDADNNPSPIAVDHRATEQMLRDSGVFWTALRNGWYMDRLVQIAAEMVRNGQVEVDPEDGGTAWITRDDLALAAAAVLSEPGHENRVYELTGSSRVNAADVAAIASEITGDTIQVIESEDGMSLSMDSGHIQTNDFRTVTGRDPVTVRQYLQANANALRSQSPN